MGLLPWRLDLLCVACLVSLVLAGPANQPGTNDLGSNEKHIPDDEHGNEDHGGGHVLHSPDDEHGHEDHGGKGSIHQQWGYNKERGKFGPSMWQDIYKEQCGLSRKRQSPIDIRTEDVVFAETLEAIELVPGREYEHNMYIFNNGHTVVLNVEGDIFIVGGGLGDVYKVVQLHFHWGNDTLRGSEHQINGQRYPLEMHIVTYDSERYGSLGEAVKGYNSIAVLGVLFKTQEQDNTAFQPIITHLKDIRTPSQFPDALGVTSTVDWLDLNTLLPEDTSQYYRYPGSLTTPGCEESVLWTVFATNQYISPGQLNFFHQLWEVEEEKIELVNNFREPQPLWERRIYSSFVVPKKYGTGAKDTSDPDSKEGRSAVSAGDNGSTALSISFSVLAAAVLGSTYFAYSGHQV